MKPPEDPRPEEPPSKPTRSEEARRIIEEYAADLREVIRKLRRKWRSSYQPTVNLDNPQCCRIDAHC